MESFVILHVVSNFLQLKRKHYWGGFSQTGQKVIYVDNYGLCIPQSTKIVCLSPL